MKGRNELRRRIEMVIYSSGSGVLGKVVQFLGLTYLAYIFNAEQYGRLAILQVAVTGVATLVGSGLALAANKSAAAVRFSHPGATPVQVLRATFVTYKKSLVLHAIANTALVPVISGIISQEMPSVAVLTLGIASSSMLFTDIVVGSLAGFGRFRASSLVDGIRGTGSGVFAATLGTLYGYVGAAYGLVLTDAVIVAVTFALVTRRTKVSSDQLTVPRLNLVVTSGIASSIFSQVANWVIIGAIQSMFGLTGTALYSLANRFASLVLIVPGFLSKNMLGEISRSIESKDEARFRSTVRFYVVGTVSFSTLASGACALIVLFFFDGLIVKYPDLYAVLCLLLVASCLRALGTSLGMICVAQDRLKVWVMSDVVAMIIVVAGVVLVNLAKGSIYTFLVIPMLANAFVVAARVGAAKWR